jgi:hypothetical protein
VLLLRLLGLLLLLLLQLILVNLLFRGDSMLKRAYASELTRGEHASLYHNKHDFPDADAQQVEISLSWQYAWIISNHCLYDGQLPRLRHACGNQGALQFWHPEVGLLEFTAKLGDDKFATEDRGMKRLRWDPKLRRHRCDVVVIERQEDLRTKRWLGEVGLRRRHLFCRQDRDARMVRGKGCKKRIDGRNDYH